MLCFNWHLRLANPPESLLRVEFSSVSLLDRALSCFRGESRASWPSNAPFELPGQTPGWGTCSRRGSGAAKEHRRTLAECQSAQFRGASRLRELGVWASHRKMGFYRVDRSPPVLHGRPPSQRSLGARSAEASPTRSDSYAALEDLKGTDKHLAQIKRLQKSWNAETSSPMQELKSRCA